MPEAHAVPETKPAAEGPTAHAAGPVDAHDLELKVDAQKRVTFEVDDGFSLEAPSSTSVVNAGTIAGG